ncbi:hypothetical protein [Roseomonas fluvialis]|uniref:Uncharacterized protein n=1 Tax=Roseomonas fluvialis TaxID=1750527 RepID=A0ABN6P392_9PROT|nr:hypothetical protein [Roseomonas fluvialis]BDG73119.1 hypothetical protein Rmf_30480 [Roseomonas fluvialis]
MRVQVVLSEEAKEAAAFRNRPFALGLLVTPLAALAGTLAFHWAGQRTGAGQSDLRDLLKFGAIIGSIYLIPVTLILLPLMQCARLPALAYPIVGAFAGPFGFGTYNPFVALPATVGGLVASLVFAWVNRARPAAANVTPPRASSTTDREETPCP